MKPAWRSLAWPGEELQIENEKNQITRESLFRLQSLKEAEKRETGIITFVYVDQKSGQTSSPT